MRPRAIKSQHSQPQQLTDVILQQQQQPQPHDVLKTDAGKLAELTWVIWWCTLLLVVVVVVVLVVVVDVILQQQQQQPQPHDVLKTDAGKLAELRSVIMLLVLVTFRDVKIVFSWQSIIVCWKSIFSRLSFPDVSVTVGCSNILGCCTVRSDEAAAVKAGGGEAGLQRRRLNRPALHTARTVSYTHLTLPTILRV